MIVVLVEPAQLLWFLGTLQLSSHIPVLRAVACLYRQTAAWHFMGILWLYLLWVLWMKL
ncbi:MAG TPA: hypothetical protein VFF64_07935 [Candidatus Eremiobacteraceae bacterium]|nr:hypothetical protein [Candidatus Eremiobacteraceae bacterium]